MLAFWYEIRGLKTNTLVKRDSGYEKREQAIRAGAQYLQNNEAAIRQAEDPDEMFEVNVGEEIIGGSL